VTFKIIIDIGGTMAFIPSSGTQGFDIAGADGGGLRYQDISPVLVTYLQLPRTLLSLIPMGEEFLTEMIKWNEDKLNPDQVTETGGMANTSADTTMTFSAADLNLLDIYNVLEPVLTLGNSASEQVMVKSINTANNTAVVTRGYGGSTVGSHAATVVWKQAGVPTQASTDTTRDLTRQRVEKQNLIYRQEFTVILGYEAIMQTLMGYVPGVRNEFAYQFKKRLDERFRNLHTAAWMGRIGAGSDPGVNGKDGSTMWGIWKMLDGTFNTNSTVGQTSGVFSNATIDSMSKFVLDQGGNLNVVIGNSTVIGRMSSLNNDKVRTDYHETSRGQITEVYRTPYGHDLRMVYDPILNDSAGSLQVAALDAGRIRIKPYAGSFLSYIQAPVNYDGDIGRCVNRCSLEVRNTGTDIGQSHQVASGMS
jgi:hypothetical protein